jgi:UDP:flavonoid glycosyltransferase YjiC (YdhE family)
MPPVVSSSGPHGFAARILVAMFQGGGNIPLIVPVLAELAARGHDVKVLVGPGVRPSRLSVSPDLLGRLANAGTKVALLREPKSHPYDNAPPVRGVIRGWSPPAFRRAPVEARPALWSPIWAEGVAQELRDRAADVVVADFVLSGALAAAEAAGVPGVALAHTVLLQPTQGVPPYGPGWMPGAGLLPSLRDKLGHAIVERIHRRDALPSLNRARSALDLPPLRSAFGQLRQAARILVLAGSAFDFPAGPGAAANIRHTGSPIDDAGAPLWVPPWPVEDRRPLVLVGLSTLAQGQDDLMRRCIEAVGQLDTVRALVMLGPSLDPSRFKAPANVVLEPFVPHSSVMPLAAAMITQCGLGTVSKSLGFGLPMVCLPLIGDQPDNAVRVASRGAGLHLSALAPARDIAAAIHRIVTEPSFRQAAAKLGAAMAAEGPPAKRAADEIEAVVRQAQIG